jgi:hypothetical protein
LKKLASLALVGLATILASGCRPTPKSKELPGADPIFSGVVRDSVTPVADVSIALYKGTSLLLRTVTDRAGRFSFGTQLPGDYRFAIASRVYAGCESEISFWPPQRDVSIGVIPVSDTSRLRQSRAANGNSCTCSIPMRRAYSAAKSTTRRALFLPSREKSTVAVDVLDSEDRSGVERVLVVLYPDPKREEGRLVAFTDETGRASFVNVASGKYRVVVRQIGFAPSEMEIIATAGRADSLELPFKWEASGLCKTLRTGL